MPRQQLTQQLPQQPPDILNAAKRCVVYKLLLLENARAGLDRELQNFTEQAHAEVHNFLNTEQPTDMRDCDNIMKALEVKCHVIQQLSVAAKNLTTEPQSTISASSGPRGLYSQLELPRDRRIMTSDVLKFGPMLQNILMARSISRAVQMLGATLSLQQLHLHLSSQPECQVDLFLCSVASSVHHTALKPPRPPSLNRDKEAKKVTCQEKKHQSVMIKPVPPSPVTILKPQPSWEPIVTGLPDPGRPPVPPVLLTPWRDNQIQVLHQKLTSPQLVHFLRSNSKNNYAEVTYGKGDYIQYTTSHSPAAVVAAAALVDGKSDQQAREGERNDQRGSPELVLRRELFSEMGIQAPVFTVKRVDSGGSITYTCLIASRTELWDVGDIFTEVRKVSGESICSSEETGLQSCRVDSCITLAPHPSSSSLSQATEYNPKRDPQISSSLAVNHLSVPEFHGGTNLSIPEFKIHKFEEMAVVVSHMVSPGNFYIQHADSCQQLQDLHAELEAGLSFAELQRIPDLGTFVMGWFPTQECWCRAQVTKICGMSGDNIHVEVRRLDYGDTSSLSLSDIKELCPEMTSLPLQAMQVSLANVVPVDSQAWTQQAVEWFRDMVENRTLFARLYPQPGKDGVQVELFMERGNIGAMRRGASLSLRLAQNGHARHNKMRNVGIIKRSRSQEQARAWEKYVISCYTQNKKRGH